MVIKNTTKRLIYFFSTLTVMSNKYHFIFLIETYIYLFYSDFNFV
jgi:hypothetical protein